MSNLYKDKMPLFERLMAYGRSEIYPFHMPGHKRRLAPVISEGDQGSRMLEALYACDITEIDGFDDLHHAEGILKEAQDAAASLFHAEETHFLVGGSTAGILASIASVCRPGDEILIARNCHKSVYHAVEILGLKPIYIYPQVNTKYGIFEGIYPLDVEKLWISHQNIRAIVITSPTYEGIVSDVRTISDISHSHHIPLIVDEAHGAHFIFSDYFPESAVTLGADLVIQSTHKTLPAMTSTALLHRNGKLVDRDRLNRMLGIYQTSSPSYILMASIDSCMHLMAAHGQEIFEGYTALLEKTRDELHRCRHIQLPELSDFDRERSFDYDRSKLLLSVRQTGLDGVCFHDMLLHRFGLQMEMKSTDSVLAMTGPGDDAEGMARLVHAVCVIDEEIGKFKYEKTESRKTESGRTESGKSRSEKGSFDLCSMNAWPKAKAAMLPCQAVWEDGEMMVLESCEDRISLDYIYLYPPGIPLVVPGEYLTDQIIQKIRFWIVSGMEVTGLQEEDNHYFCRVRAKHG